jgi:Phenylpropionate dioxygenase and related ring-hydroxylating dioxygenases, large terminal subunit
MFGSSKTLSHVLKSIDKARGLPNRHYIDKTVFEKENKELLLKNWCGIGFGKDVPKIGDVFPVNFLGLPLLLVRDELKQIRVFQNTCRHRGMILVQEKGNVRGTIRCPYHSWCYGLTGELRATPHVGGPGINIHKKVDRSKLGLFEISSHVWHDVVFVNFEKDAPCFKKTNAKLLDRWSEFSQPPPS